jgi:hypothetical protein
LCILDTLVEDLWSYEHEFIMGSLFCNIRETPGRSVEGERGGVSQCVQSSS